VQANRKAAFDLDAAFHASLIRSSLGKEYLIGLGTDASILHLIEGHAKSVLIDDSNSALFRNIAKPVS
jgi:hypothetical protein